MTISKLLKNISVVGYVSTATLLTLGTANSADAVTMSFTGTFGADNSERIIFDRDITEPSVLTVQTFSYGGGTQADGNVVSPGGFDPVITIFKYQEFFGRGEFFVFAQSGSGTGNTDPETGASEDVLITTNLTLEPNADVTAYTVFITQWDNFYDEDRERFEYEDDSTFTSEFGCSNGQFCDFTNANRTNQYAVDITIEPIPEPVTILGSLTALGIGSLLKKKRQTIK